MGARVSATDAERLRAGLAADDRIADDLAFACKIPDRVPDFTGAGGPAAEQFWGRFTPVREVLEAEAKRQILALYEEFTAEQDRQLADPVFKTVGPGIRTGTEVLGQVVAALAGVYAEAEERANG